MSINLKEIDCTEFRAVPIDSMSKLQLISRLNRVVPKRLIHTKRVGRYYTESSVADSAPRSLLFRTRRAAKKFFSNPIMVCSPKQFIALYGSPSKISNWPLQAEQRIFRAKTESFLAETELTPEQEESVKNKLEAFGVCLDVLKPQNQMEKP